MEWLIQVSCGVCFLVEHKQVKQNFYSVLEQHENKDLRNSELEGFGATG